MPKAKKLNENKFLLYKVLKKIKKNKRNKNDLFGNSETFKMDRDSVMKYLILEIPITFISIYKISKHY